MRYFVAFSPIIAWVAGLVAFAATAIAISGNGFSDGDFAAILVWAALGVLITMPAIYWPAMVALEKVLRGREPLFAFPMTAAALALPTTCLVGLLFGGNPLTMAGSEFVLVFAFLAPVGIVTGVAFAVRRVAPGH